MSYFACEATGDKVIKRSFRNSCALFCVREIFRFGSVFIGLNFQAFRHSGML